LVSKPGIFMEELMKEIDERQLKQPLVYGLPMDDRGLSNEKIIEDFDGFIHKRIAEAD
jgi:hypothetical protein